MTLVLTMLLVSVPSFAGTNRWTTSGPAGASITALVVDPLDSRIVYAVTSGAGIFRSIATGEPWWESANTGLTETVISAIAIDATDPKVLFAATPTGAVLRSEDRGEHWTTRFASMGEYVRAIAIDGKRSRIFVATDSGVLMGDIEEGTWRAVLQNHGGFSSVTVVSDGTVYAASWDSVYVSEDGGGIWTSALTEPSISTLVSDPKSSAIYAAANTAVMMSIDRGRSWRRLPVTEARITSLLAFQGALYAATDRGAYLYESGTSRWARVGSFSRAVTALAFAAPSRMFAGTKAGVLTALARGSDWHNANDGMNAALVLDLAAAEGDVAYATTHEGLFQTTDGAATWRKVPDLKEPLAHAGGGSGCCSGAAIATSGPDTIFVAGQTGVHRSTDQARTWEIVTPNIASALAVSSDATTLYAAFSDGMARSTDRGETWRFASTGLFDSAYGSYSWNYTGASAVETDADGPSVVYAGYAEGLFRTSDSGESWQRVGGQASPHNTSLLAMVARGPVVHFSGWNLGVTSSVDGGETWSSARLIGENVLALALDPLDPSRVYAGTAGGRVYRSEDHGQEWVPFGEPLLGDGMPGAASVHRLAISDSGKRIYAGTSAGIFVYQIGDALSKERLPDDALRLPSLMQQVLSGAGPPEGAPTVDPAVAFILPTIGTVRGSAGSVFRTDVTLSNGRTSAQDVLLAWLPQGNLAGSVVPMFRIELPPSVDDSGGTLTIDDIADELGLSGLGSLAVFAVDAQGRLDHAADIDGSARVRSPASCGSGSMSQSWAAIKSFDEHRKAKALGLRHEWAYRTNVGIVNLGEVAREFTILVAGERHVGSLTVTVAPFSLFHAAVPGGNYGAISITVVSDEGRAPWAAFGSSVDNASGDSWTSVAAPKRER